MLNKKTFLHEVGQSPCGARAAYTAAATKWEEVAVKR